MLNPKREKEIILLLSKIRLYKVWHLASFDLSSSSLFSWLFKLPCLWKEGTPKQQAVIKELLCISNNHWKMGAEPEDLWSYGTSPCRTCCRGSTVWDFFFFSLCGILIGVHLGSVLRYGNFEKYRLKGKWDFCYYVLLQDFPGPLTFLNAF